MSDKDPADQRSSSPLRRVLLGTPGLRGLAQVVARSRNEPRLQAALRELQAEREEWQRNVARLQQERDDLRLSASQLQQQHDHWRQDAERLRQGAEQVQRDCDHWRQTAQSLSQGFDGLFQSLTAQFAAAREVMSNDVQLLGAQLLATRAALDAGLRGLSRSSAGAGGGQATGLYLDLLEASLTGLLNEDGSIAPWTGGGYDPARRAIGRDWPATACTMIGTARMRNLRHLLERALDEGVPGDFIETGVWRGGACIYARGIMAAHGDATRRVFVADSFRGLPEPDAAAFPEDAGDTHSTFEQLAISRDQVAGNFRRYGLLDERVIFLEGWFKDTLPAAPIERLAVLRLDGDMYESTIQALDALYDKVSPGGYVIVDDYILGPCARAIEDFRATRGITATLEPVDGAAVWWQVPK